MVANPSDFKVRFTIAAQPILVEDGCPSLFLPGEQEFPDPPALLNTLLQLELCLSETAPDLHAITAIIRNDIGLTAQLLRLAAHEIKPSPAKILPLSEIVVHVGVEGLKALLARTQAPPEHLKTRSVASAYERFCIHVRLIALIAEELADKYAVNPEEAYLAGLLSYLGDLPSLLGWEPIISASTHSTAIGYDLACAWKFPQGFVDVIGGDPELCRSRESRALLEIVTSAGIWASRLEFLAARESPAVRAKNPPYGPRCN